MNIDGALVHKLADLASDTSNEQQTLRQQLDVVHAILQDAAIFEANLELFTRAKVLADLADAVSQLSSDLAANKDLRDEALMTKPAIQEAIDIQLTNLTNERMTLQTSARKSEIDGAMDALLWVRRCVLLGIVV